MPVVDSLPITRKRKGIVDFTPQCSPPKRRVNKNYLIGKKHLLQNRSFDSVQESALVRRTRNKKRQLAFQVIRLYQVTEAKGSQLMRRKDEIRSSISNNIRELFNGAYVYIIGSTVNGLAVASSGLDLLVLFDKSFDDPLKLLKAIEPLIRREDFVTHLQLKGEESEVVCLTFVDSLTHIVVTLGVNQETRILSTKLVKTYTRIDNRVAPLIVTVKSWWNQIGICTDRLLNGYTIALMAIHFLQSGCMPAVLPGSQTLIMQNELHNFDLRSQRLYQPLPSFQSENYLSVGELLHDLFEYYVHRFAFAKQVISIRNAIPIPKSTHLKDLGSSRKNPLYVEEPFDLTNTAASVDSDEAMETVHEAFRRTLYRLTFTESLEAVFY